MSIQTEPSSLRTLATHSVRWNGASILTLTVLQLFQTIFLARLLSPEQFGLIGLVLIAAGFAQSISDFGLGNAIIFKQTSDQKQLSSIYWANVFGGVSVFFITISLTPILARFYQENTLRLLIPAASITFLISPFGLPMMSILQRDLKFKKIFFCETTSSILGAVTAIFFAWKLKNAFAIIWGQLATTIIRTVFLVIFSQWKPSIHFKLEDLRTHFSFSMYQTGQKLINFLVQNLDKILIGKLLGTNALGFYTMAYQLMSRPILLLNPIITRVAFPVFSRMHGNIPRIKLAYLGMIQYIAFVMMPLYLCMYVTSESIIQTFLGNSWISINVVFKILLILGLIQSLGNPLDSLLLALGKAKISFWFNVYALILYAIAIPIGAQFGLNGVALGLLIVCGCILVPSDLWLRWVTSKMTPGEYANAWFPFFIIGLIVAIFLFVLTSMLQMLPPYFLLIIQVCAGIVFYLGIAFIWDRKFIIRISKLLTEQI